MDDLQATLALSGVKSKADALEWWAHNPDAVHGTTLVVSHDEPSNLTVPVRRTYGRGFQLLSMFGAPNLMVLNDRIFDEMEQRGSASVGVDFNIAFDTSAASLLRKLFAGRNNASIDDLRQFMDAVQGNRINWDVRPYLHENSEALLAGERAQEIYETVLASEQLSSLDIGAFLTRGDLKTVEPIEQLRGRAGAVLAEFLDGLRTYGWIHRITESRQPIYASVLYMTLLERSFPGRQYARRKLKQLIEFMDTELSALFLAILWMAWRWFDSDDRTAIFDVLQSGGKEPVEKASNISWDLLHMIQQPQLVVSSRKGADVLIPSFLTADKKLANLWEVYPIRSCWARTWKEFPYSVPMIDLGQELDSIVGNHTAFSGEAYARRQSRRNEMNRPPLDELIKRLEHQLGS